MSLIVTDGKQLLSFNSSGRIGVEPIYIPCGRFTIGGKEVKAFSIVGSPCVYDPIVGLLTDFNMGLRDSRRTHDLMELLRMAGRFMRYIPTVIRGTIVAVLEDGKSAEITVRRNHTQVVFNCCVHAGGKVVTVGNHTKSPTASPDLLTHFLENIQPIDQHSFRTNGYCTFTLDNDTPIKVITPSQ